MKYFGLPLYVVVLWNSFVAILPNILLVLALVYAILNISYLLWKWNKQCQNYNK